MVRVAVIDGLPDLGPAALSQPRITIESSMVPDGFDHPDAHGTEVFSLIVGASGPLALDCDIDALSLPIFFSDPDGLGPRAASQTDIARALTIAAERGADIVNVSAGQKSSTIEGGRHLEDALALCQARRMLVVAAAGNDGCACLHVPAAVPTVLAVGAMDRDGQPFSTSNWGAAYARNGVLAPGVDLDVVSLNGEAARRSGTSFAAAVVSRTAACLLGAAREAGYALDALDIRSILIDTADPCDPAGLEDCNRLLAGRLNPEAALARVHDLGNRPATAPAAAAAAVEQSEDREISIMATTAAPGRQAPANTPGEGAASVKPSGDPGESGPAAPQAAAVEAAPAAESAGRPLVGQSACSACETETAEEDKADIEQSGCSGGDQPPQTVYALGALWFDFGTEARYDAIVQAIGDPVAANTPAKLFDFLSENLEYASGITFILMQDQIPLYAIQPHGPFAIESYRALLDGLKESLKENGEMHRVAVPGLSAGTVRLMNGMALPVVFPDLRGMAQWKASDLVDAARRASGDDEMDPEPIFNFLVRVYDELRNMGMSPEDRAINFAATNAYQAAIAFGDALSRKMELYAIQVKKSPICRPDSDCWDVHLQMFDPENDRRAGRVYRYTVDVSETLPVTVGPVRAWSAPLAGL